MKKTGFYVLMATCVLLLASCSGLNESAQNVKYSTKSEAPKDCKEIGEVSVGSFLPHMTMESVKNEMRNKTSAMGGNFLVIDEIKSVSSSTPPTVGSNGLMTGGGTSSSGYAGSGTHISVRKADPQSVWSTWPKINGRKAVQHPGERSRPRCANLQRANNGLLMTGCRCIMTRRSKHRSG